MYQWWGDWKGRAMPCVLSARSRDVAGTVGCGAVGTALLGAVASVAPFLTSVNADNHYVPLVYLLGFGSMVTWLLKKQIP